MVPGAPTVRNEGFLHPLERTAIAWLVKRVPEWVTPDILTGIGFIGALITFAGYAASGFYPEFLWIASCGLIINWYGDSLDGAVARFRGIGRPRYGFCLDHTLDCVVQLLIAFGVGLSGYVRWDICFFTLSSYLMLAVLSYIRTNVVDIFQISYMSIGPTEVRFCLVVLNFVILVYPPTPLDWFGISLSYPNILSLIWAILMLGNFAVSAIKQVRQLAKQEPPLRRPQTL
jgi:phosphatidylglycerophosphate synthase